MSAREVAMVELLMLLERATYDEAKAFVVVQIDSEGRPISTTGPFTEPEQALLQAGRDDADWKRHAQPGEGDFEHVIVPLWEPSL